MSKQKQRGVPLTPAVFYILVALYGQDRHGYDIMRQVNEDSEGKITMGPGTLYGSIDRMIKAGFVATSNKQDPRRIYYKLTAEGKMVFKEETERISQVSAIARRQLKTA